MIKKGLILLLGVFFSVQAFSAEGYRLKIKITDFQGDQLLLGYHYGDKQYIKDTVSVGTDGFYTFEGDEPLEGGIYLLVMPPDNNIIQVLINEDDQNFTFITESENPFTNTKIEGSKENELFYGYMRFLGDRRKEVEPINAALKEAEGDEKKTAELKAQLAKINEQVQAKQAELIKNHPKSLTALIIRSSQDIDPPAIDKTVAEYEKKRWEYYKMHWFDNVNLKDDRLLRSPVMFQRIDQYLKNVTVQHPDSISSSIDRILGQMPKDSENFKFYVIHFLNTYAKSKIVGMDAVYVHIVKNYYAKGLAPWTEEDQLKKIVKNAEKLEPLLIGKIAPDIKVFKKGGGPVSLHGIKSDFTVLFFWDPDCGHCKKSMPDMIKFYNEFKGKGVEILAICTKLGADEPKCWEHIEEKGMDIWINATDQYLKSKFKTLYDIQTTPQVYVLDENKKIISKRIGADQLGEVIEQFIKIKEDKEKKP